MSADGRCCRAAKVARKDWTVVALRVSLKEKAEEASIWSEYLRVRIGNLTSKDLVDAGRFKTRDLALKRC
jgi:hypothetical protein